MKILIIAAHPDDEVLGMGGTITKYVKSGHEIKIIIMATGIFARRTKNYRNSTQYDLEKKTSKSLEKELVELQKDALKASKIMGVKNIEFMNFPDNEMDTISNLQVVKKIESLIDQFEPSIIYTHSKYDVNIDHRILYDATITATRPTADCKVKEVYSFEIPSSSEWNFPSNFSPNIFIDINKELTTKIKAMKAYKNEIRKFPHPRSVEALNIIAKRWGSVSGLKAAEAFSLVRKISTNV